MRQGISIRDWVDWRQPGGLVSVGIHAAFLIAGVVAFSSPKAFTPAEESSPVDIVSEQQFNEVMKGQRENAEERPEPQARVDRVAPEKKENDPGQARKDVTQEPPKAVAAPEPPIPPAPPTPPQPVEQRVAVVPPQRPPELRTRMPQPAPPEPEEEEKDAEPIKRAAPKPPEPKPPEPKKVEPPPDPLAKILEEKKREEEKARAEAAAKAAEERKKAEEKRIEEKRVADEKRKAEAEKKQREAREKAAKDAAEAKKLEDSIRQRLNASKETAQSTGATGAQVSRQASLGAPNATGKTLSPSDRSRLVGILTDQMNRCLSIPPGVMPKTPPIVNIQLGRDGSITGGPSLTNPRNEPGFMPFAEANMRALRNCAPYRIPERFLETYNDWKNLSIGIVPSDS